LIRQLLDECVEQHLLSDVPLGIFLSGGIDSSALVALAQSFRDKPPTTLSIVFDEPEYDESKYSRLIANKYQTSHIETRLTHAELIAELPSFFAAMDQPTVDGVNSFFISRSAKQAGLTVVLSGLGGDEVFLGYNHLRRASGLERSRSVLARLPTPLRRALIEVAIPTVTLTGRGSLEKLRYLESPARENLYLLFRGLFTPRQIQRLMDLTQAEMNCYGVTPQTLNGSSAASLTDSLVINEFEHYLQDQLLKDTDCFSMAHSIETRVPFLDHELVKYVFGLPAKLKVDARRNKRLLLDALGDDFPREIWDRPKMGFTFPFELWLRDLGLDSNGSRPRSNGLGMTFLAGADQDFLVEKEVQRVWAGFRNGTVHWSRPWALTVLSQFRKQ
jgi:asparagine synthase (glutamine-hydrolysing)